MKVIGAGFGRTGTMSLKAALEQLGAGPCFHMIDIIRDQSNLPYWVGQGWGPLADMLGVEAPDTPFPHLNDTDSFRQMFGLPAMAA